MNAYEPSDEGRLREKSKKKKAFVITPWNSGYKPDVNEVKETNGLEKNQADLLLFENRINNNPRYVNDVALAYLLNLSVHTIRKWRCQGLIKPYVFGRSVRYVVDEVVAALTQKGFKLHEKQRR